MKLQLMMAGLLLGSAVYAQESRPGDQMLNAEAPKEAKSADVEGAGSSAGTNSADPMGGQDVPMNPVDPMGGQEGTMSPADSRMDQANPAPLADMPADKAASNDLNPGMDPTAFQSSRPPVESPRLQIEPNREERAMEDMNRASEPAPEAMAPTPQDMPGDMMQAEPSAEPAMEPAPQKTSFEDEGNSLTPVVPTGAYEDQSPSALDAEYGYPALQH
jgi:hypothetical protein